MLVWADQPLFQGNTGHKQRANLNAKSLIIWVLTFLAGKRDESDQNVQSEGFEVLVAKTAPVEHLDFQVDSFSKAIIDTTNEAIEDLLPPVAHGVDKLLQYFER